jgi:6-phospho-beta-glucosidase
VKIAIIGGGGVRVPLLVGGLARAGLGITEAHLFDTNAERAITIGPLAAQMAPGIETVIQGNPYEAIRDASFVITSIRVGGSEQRARDEATAIAHGIIGQETIGPAGFAMAVRSIPPLIEIANVVREEAPDAWLINFTNPVSIITQAVHQQTGVKLIGICDTPLEMFEDAAHALGLPATTCSYDYFGLNHLGWLRDVLFEGEGQLHRLWNDEQRLLSAYRAPLFEAERLRAMRLLPTEYLYYYYRPDVALANMKRAGSSRGETVAKLTRDLFQDLKTLSADDLVTRYQQYLAARDASYMQLETGSSEPRIKPDWAELSGYDKIALFTIRAIVQSTNAVIPLDVPNRGTLPFLEDNDIIEAQCRVDRNGPQPLPVATIPDHARELITTVKKYERATISAALSGDRGQLAEALALNPLVPSTDIAQRLVAAML